MKSKKTLLGWVVGVAFSLAIPFTVFSFLTETRRDELPILGQVQEFTLTDSNGKAFHSDTLSGKVWIANFFFTTCSGVCPILSKNMASLSRSFEGGQEIKLVSMTVNPEQDSPEVLIRYADQFRGNKKNWHFLTGPREAITEVIVKSFKVGDMKEPVFHSTFFPLVDSKGFIRGYYDGTKEEDVNRLFRDAVFLAKEVSYGDS